MNQLSIQQRARILSCLIEGCSLRSTVRMTGACKRTVSRFLVEMGEACETYHNQTMRNLKCRTIQVDEIWTFTYCKQANIPTRLKGASDIGDTWTWVAIDADTKLIPAYLVGKRDTYHAKVFMEDLAGRLTNRVQLTSDGHRPYIEAVESAFGSEIDYAMLIKLFGKQYGDEGRYSPPKCTGIRRRSIQGSPVRERISTSFAERQNLTLRMQNRRFTRLTNGYSKKLENHKHALAIHFLHYNFARIHHTLRVPPAMEAGVSNHVWSLWEIVELLNKPSK